MVKTIISAYPTEKRAARQDGSIILNIAECFCDTIQGENMVGYPATFLRLQGCTLNCVWCDTTEVWRNGNPYSVNEVLDLLEENEVINKLKFGQHLVLTGGSPIKQQVGLTELIEGIKTRYGFKPYIEVETECTIMPSDKMFKYVDLWNCSPKLETSGMPLFARYHPIILKKLFTYNSYFKFVITKEEDWKEIEEYYIKPGLVNKDRIVLMPEGMTREELQQHYQIVIDLCCKYNIRMCDRLHISIWNKKVGV